jgi:hypothetical protein
LLAPDKTCGDFGGRTKSGSPCTRKAFWGLKKNERQGSVPGRCKHHREGIFLSPQEKRFVELYCGSEKFNAKRAALGSYNCSEAYAGQLGYETLNKPYVRKAIDQRLDEFSMNQGEILARVTALARGDLSPFLQVSENGERVTFNFGTEEAQRSLGLIKKMKMTQHVIEGDREGDDQESFTIERRTEVELHDALSALKELVRVRGLISNKHELTGAGGKDLGGVLVVPARIPAEEWNAQAKNRVNALTKDFGGNGGKPSDNGGG